MIRFVVDASCVGPLVLPDEAENLLPIVLVALEAGSCIVPSHWRFEVGNFALMGLRRGRVSHEMVSANLLDLDQFDVATDAVSAELAWTNSFAIAQEAGLTLYDAAYLELARRLNLALLTMDGSLLKAASRLGVATNPLP